MENILTYPLLSESGEIPMAYRENTTDLNCIKEVIEEKTYRHTRIGFDIEEGEEWLDLGGNIGAFGMYCFQKGASCVSYEPEEENFEILKYNYSSLRQFKPSISLKAIKSAVTAFEGSEIEFFNNSRKKSDRYRYTTRKVSTSRSLGRFKNKFIGDIKLPKKGYWDGVKMDIETSEFPMIDNRLIPKCNKLVIEYHISKDKSMSNFHNRMEILRELFDFVYYIPSLDKFDPEGEYPGFFDRVIHCKNNF